MRVCHIISSFRPVIGGAERATETLVGALRDRGVDVVVLTRRYAREDARFELVDGIPVHRLGMPGRGKFQALTFSLHVFFLLATTLRTYRTLHVQNIDTPLLVGMLAKVTLRRDLVATIHGETQIVGRGANWLGRRRMDMMARLVDAFTSINPVNTKALVDVGVKRRRIHEVPNSIDTEIFRPPKTTEKARARAMMGIPNESFVAAYVGRLQPYKRVDLVIDAWARLDGPDERVLLIVGEGPEAERLAERGRPLGRLVRFEGPSDAPVDYLHAADVYVNASGDPDQAWSEGLSVALLEAMATALMPIVTSGPGNDVLVTNDQTGLTIAVGDGEALLGCLTRAIAEPEMRNTLGLNAHERVVGTYSSSAVAARIEGVYGEATKSSEVDVRGAADP